MRAHTLLIVIIVTGFVACAAEGQLITEERQKAREERSIALGVNLIKWDDAQPDGGWTRWSPRPGLAPAFDVDRKLSSKGVPALKLGGAGKRYVFGGWKRTITRIEAGKAYRFRADVEAAAVPSARRAILCQIQWKGTDLGNEITPEYVNNISREQGYIVTLDETFSAPDGADSAEISLLVQWTPEAELTFKNVSLETAVPEGARMVKVATVYWRPKERSTPEKNIEAFSALIDKVAEKKPDVVLLPEAATFIGTGLSVVDSAQEVAGPAFFAFSAKAKEHKCYIIYGAYEKEKDLVFNSAIIIGRDGTFVGKYRKVQLPYSEADSGLSPGDYFKTFKLDFGKIGILICYDTAFDEPARVEMLDGAEMIFVPIWGGDMVQLKARAIDNAVYVVTSGYDVPSMVIDPAGEVIAMTWQDIGDGTAFAMVDLSRKIRKPYIGDWSNVVLKHRRTDAYNKVIED